MGRERQVRIALWFSILVIASACAGNQRRARDVAESQPVRVGSILHGDEPVTKVQPLLPTEAAARVALRTQQVIAYESGVIDTADPLAGSYAIEHLTDEIEEDAQEYLKKIEAMGGMLRAIETGYVQREIQESAYRYQKAVETQEQVVVGVNRFQVDEEPAVSVLRIDPAIEQAQVERVRADTDRDTAYVQAEVVRRSDYLRDLALAPAAAKELRIWGMTSWLIGRFDAAWLQAMAPIWRTRSPNRPTIWLTAAVVAAIASTGAKDVKMAGRVVGEVMKAHKGKAEAADVKKIAEEELAKLGG